ncbi:hypothetical protein LN429_14905 [Pseudomonas syringae]|uniref:hypothetical protein n=1 Tax=Pseudomonas syringae TaxID=317 RepID=UPI00234D6E4C|nr:hypothetical protein [Pseudomonas syringae]MDC6536391.1 hypothetical protein [Pseudomonas syringae]
MLDEQEPLAAFHFMVNQHLPLYPQSETAIEDMDSPSKAEDEFSLFFNQAG